MKPYYEHGGITIYHADCREVLPHLGTVDMVLTDPPYGVGYSTRIRKNIVRSSNRLIGDLLFSPLNNDTAALMDSVLPETAALMDSVLPETAALMDSVLPETAALYIFSAPERLDFVMSVLRTAFDVANVLVWDKGNCTAGDLETTYGGQWESIVYARKGRPILLGGRDRDVLRYSRGNTAAYLHPTQKPIPLLRYLIGRHDAPVILDPFMGSGTTLRAAKDLGRKAIGIEIEERYCEVAAKRLMQEVLL